MADMFTFKALPAMALVGSSSLHEPTVDVLTVMRSAYPNGQDRSTLSCTSWLILLITVRMVAQTLCGTKVTDGNSVPSILILWAWLWEPMPRKHCDKHSRTTTLDTYVLRVRRTSALGIRNQIGHGTHEPKLVPHKASKGGAKVAR